MLRGPISAVSKPIVASKYSCERSWRDLQDLHTFAPLESNRKTMKSASGKRPPDKAHSAPEKKLSSRISCAWGIREKGVHTFAPLQSQNFSKKSVWKINNFLWKFNEISENFRRILANSSKWMKKCDFRAVQRSALCKSWRELSNAYLLSKFGFDTAESEPAKVGRQRSRPGGTDRAPLRSPSGTSSSWSGTSLRSWGAARWKLNWKLNRKLLRVNRKLNESLVY